jgi:hypothetical protein
MNDPLTLLVCSVFLMLALWHVCMALLPASGVSVAVPSENGTPLFVPSRSASVGVAAVLLLFTVLVAATGGVLQLEVPELALSWLSYALAIGLLARAVGEFRYVGIFKQVRGSRFATLDTLIYSPVCLLLSAGVALVALDHAGA